MNWLKKRISFIFSFIVRFREKRRNRKKTSKKIFILVNLPSIMTPISVNKSTRVCVSVCVRPTEIRYVGAEGSEEAALNAATAV